MMKLKLTLIAGLAFLWLTGISFADLYPRSDFLDLDAGKNITINDTIWNSDYGVRSQPSGPGGENNETEKRADGLTLTEQRWDFEGIFMNREKGTLTIIGGVNFLESPDGLEVGDLFIGHFDGYYESTNPEYGKKYMADYVFDFARLADTDNDGVGEFGVTGDITLRQGDFLTENPTYVTPYSDPWVYKDGGSIVAGTNLTYLAGIVDNTPFSDWVDGANDPHFFLQIFGLSDVLLQQLLTEDHNIFHMTLQCGNDAIRAAAPVPEPTTILLSGLGLLGMGLFLRKRFQPYRTNA